MRDWHRNRTRPPRACRSPAEPLHAVTSGRGTCSVGPSPRGSGRPRRPPRRSAQRSLPPSPRTRPRPCGSAGRKTRGQARSSQWSAGTGHASPNGYSSRAGSRRPSRTEGGMRFTIKAEKLPAGGWSVTVVNHATRKSILAKPRLLGEIPDDEGRLFPVPPADEADSLPGDLTEAEIAAHFDSVMGQAGDGDGVARLGRYLFRTLLARDLWEQMLAAATAEEPIELALTWDLDSPLHRLPWEVMHTGRTEASTREGFLAHEPGLLFTRRVPGTTAAGFK